MAEKMTIESFMESVKDAWVLHTGSVGYIYPIEGINEGYRSLLLFEDVSKTALPHQHHHVNQINIKMKQMAKKLNLTKKRSEEMTAAKKKLERALKKKKMNRIIHSTDSGYSLPLYGENGSMVVKLDLTARDGEWRLNVELAPWVENMVKDAGFKINERKKPVKKK